MSKNTSPIQNILRYGLLFSGLLVSYLGQCQDVTSPRFFKLNFQRLSAPGRLISAEGNSLKSSDKDFNYIAEGQLRFPIKLKGRTKLIGQIDFDRETVFGLYTYEETEAEDFNFNNFSTAIIGIHEFGDNWSYFSRIKIQNGGEKIFPLRRNGISANFSNFLLKKRGNETFGLGFQVGYNRRISVLPVIQYQNDFVSGWGLDISLPQHILINKRVNRSHLWYAGLKGSRSNYLFRNELQEIDSELYYRRITVNAIIGVEKQLTPMFGFMAEVGATKPIRSGVYEFDGQWNKLHDFNESVAPYVKLGIFLSINKSKF